MTKLGYIGLMAAALSGCLQMEDVPVVSGDPDLGTGDGGGDAGAVPGEGTEDPSENWPPVVYERGRPIGEIAKCGESLLWSFNTSYDDLGNPRNDGEIWIWDVDASPRVLVSGTGRIASDLAGCYDGYAYWNGEGMSGRSLKRVRVDGTGDVEDIADGNWILGDDGKAARYQRLASFVDILDLTSLTISTVNLGGVPPIGVDHVWVTSTYFWVVGIDGLGRVDISSGTEWEVFDTGYESYFADVLGRLILLTAYDRGFVLEVDPDGSPLTLARGADTCDTPGVRASSRGSWLTYSMTTSRVNCFHVGRVGVDHQGNVQNVEFEELTRIVAEISQSISDSRTGLVVLQFGSQIAIISVETGAIRLVDEPDFPCVDEALPCPDGATCAATICAEL